MYNIQRTCCWPGVAVRHNVLPGFLHSIRRVVTRTLSLPLVLTARQSVIMPNNKIRERERGGESEGGPVVDGSSLFQPYLQLTRMGDQPVCSAPEPVIGRPSVSNVRGEYAVWALRKCTVRW